MSDAADPTGRAARIGASPWTAARTNFLYALAANAGTLIFQMTGLYLVIQTLSLPEVGLFLTISATGAIAGAFVGVGAIDVLTAEVARNNALAPIYTRVSLLRIIGTSGPIILAVTGGEMLLLSSLAPLTLILFNINLLLANRIVALAEGLRVAFGRSASAALLRCGYAFCQMIAIVAASILPVAEDRLLAIAIYGVLIGVLSLVPAALVLLPELSRSDGGETAPMRGGWSFMVGQALNATSGNLDRIFATAFLGEVIAGLYGLAARAGQLATLPLSILYRTIYHRFFAQSRAPGAEETILRLTVSLSIASMIAGVGGFALLVQVLATEYQGALGFLALISTALPAAGLVYYLGSQMARERLLRQRNLSDISAVAAFGIVAAVVLAAGLGPYGLAATFVASRYLNAYLYFRVLAANSRVIQ